MLDHATPADLALCRQMIRQGSKSFHLASLLLPSRYREQARALYGFCRMADDLVDHAVSPQQAVDALALRLDAVYAGTPYDHQTDRAFADVVRKFAIPRAVPDALIEGFAWDAESKVYHTVSDVTAYAVRVAGTVGVMMSLIMGTRVPAAVARAIDLGVAMQFSNIARDVEEDAQRGRVYLPADWLAADGLSRDDVLQQPQLGAEAARRLVHAAETLYGRAASGVASLPRSCRMSINAARALYREIGLESERRAFKGRAVVSSASKLRLVAGAILGSAFLPPLNAAPGLTEGTFLLEAIAQAGSGRIPPSGIDAHLGRVMTMFSDLAARRS